MDDLIRRQDAIDACGGYLVPANIIKSLPSAYPDQLTDDDFETIRIHLNAHKEALCNQRRWEEAEEYQRIIDRFMAFASAQSEIIRCEDCTNWEEEWSADGKRRHYCTMIDSYSDREFYCANAERREGE